MSGVPKFTAMPNYHDAKTPAEKIAHLRKWGCGGCKLAADDMERLHAKLVELAGDCAECNGTGISDDTHEDCEGCDDIRELI